MISAPLIVTAGIECRDELRHFVGGKASNLWQLMHRGIRVPSFYVVTTESMRMALQLNGLHDQVDELSRKFHESTLEEAIAAAGTLRLAILDLQLPCGLQNTIQRAHDKAFLSNVLCAVRSSAPHEDGKKLSFAGIYDSRTDVVGIDCILSAVKQVWASTFSERAITYVWRHELASRGRSIQMGMAVVVQEMVDAETFGIMFTCDPISGDRNTIALNLCHGPGQPLVDGEISGRSICINKSTAEIVVPACGGNEPEETHDAYGSSTDPAVVASSVELSDEQLRQIVDTGMMIEQHFGVPQDIELCFDRTGEMFALQARPVTTISPDTLPQGNHRVWDNSNIIESYSGVTLPMTFSFIRRAYAIVYHCFAEVMGISPRSIHANRDAFENMLGLFRGRVYYNLNNWYRLVALFPGYSYNRKAMETMMGVTEQLSADGPVGAPGFWRRWFIELPSLAGLIVRSSWNFVRIGAIVRAFQKRFDACYEEWSSIDFQEMPPHDIMARYQMMEERMLWNWKAPIINDFYVMVHYGLLRKLCKTWCGDESGSLQNGLLCGDGQLESAEPAKHLLRLTRTADRDPRLREAILAKCSSDLPEYVANEPQFSPFFNELQQFLERFGLRCVDELKLESHSYRDRPQRVYQLIQNYLRRSRALPDDESVRRKEVQLREETERRAMKLLTSSPGWIPRRALFRRVLNNTRQGIRHRESMRFARTRIYDILRSMLRALDQQFRELEILDTEDDIFYLTLDEVGDFINGTAVTTDLRALVEVRRAEFRRYQAEADRAPDRRFETYGMAYHGNSFRRTSNSPSTLAGTESGTESGTDTAVRLHGTGCCPGVVTGRVQVIRDPSEVREFTGEILVAERTDPGWVSVYPAFAGILVERGSPLSHSAIVAREFGIPTIVGLNGLTRKIKSGECVCMDGSRGSVEILAKSAAGKMSPAR